MLDTGTAILAPHKVTNAALDSTDSATRFVRAFGDSDTAKTALRNGIEELYRKTVVNKDTGAIDPKKHADFMDTYGRQIAVLDDSGVNIGRTLEQYGTGARRLRTEAEAATEASKGIAGQVKEQFAPEQAQIDIALRSGLPDEMEKCMAEGHDAAGLVNVASLTCG